MSNSCDTALYQEFTSITRGLNCQQQLDGIVSMTQNWLFRKQMILSIFYIIHTEKYEFLACRHWLISNASSFSFVACSSKTYYT